MAFPFLQARHFRPTESRSIDVIVIHTMEAPEKGNTAENVANYFRTTSNTVSAHYCIDNNSIVQCVRDQDVAFAAPGCNHNGLQLEHAGFARQKPEDWDDTFSAAMLGISARLASAKAQQYGIPLRWLSSADLKARHRGFTSHANVSAAFRRSTHTDPGQHFPVARYLEMVRAALGQPITIVPGGMKETHPALKRGSKGEAVSHLQRLLGGLKVDGDFGPITQIRLREVQARKRLEETGECDAETWARLHPVLRLGDSGLSVQELQAALGGIAVDGDFGPKTEAAVTAFQQAKDLATDGIVGPETWKALLR